jgi:hypothetical protein
MTCLLKIERIEYKKMKSRERKTIRVKNKTPNISYLLYINIIFIHFWEKWSKNAVIPLFLKVAYSFAQLFLKVA